MRSVVKVLALGGVVGLLLLPRPGETCGPYLPQAVFVRPSGPDRPMSSFARGRIGVILPTWRRAYLVVAYRYLESKPLSPAEERSLLEYWDVDHRIPPRDTTTKAIAGWVAARSKYLTYKGSEGTQEFDPAILEQVESPTCLAPAFVTAVATLKDRAARFGAGSPELQEWIRGQDTVFRNCAAGTSIPAQVPPTANPLLRADRAYQIAAAHFYTGQFETARQEFQAIAADNSSPWHTTASYLVGRTLVREAANTAAVNQSFNLAVLGRAEVWLKAVMNDPKDRAIRADAKSLLDFVCYRLHPEQRQHELGRLLAQGRSGPRFGQNLLDYTWLLDRFLDREPDFPGVECWTPEYERRKVEWVLRRYIELKPQRSDDLSDWLVTVQSSAPAAKNHAIEKWRSAHSVPWLVAALGKLHGGDAAAHDLTAAAAEVPSRFSAYLTVAYHRVRLARESGDYAAARRVLEQALAQSDTSPLSTVHLLQDEQMRAAASLDGFLSHLWQRPIPYDWGFDVSGEDYLCSEPDCSLAFYGTTKPAPNSPPLPQFSPAAATALNTQVPLDIFVQAALSGSLPENLRRRTAPSAWARAALLDEPDIAERVAEAAEKAQGELKPYLRQYAQARSSEERQFVAVFTVLHFPGLRPFVDDSYPRATAVQKIDEYRDNWWCQDVGSIPEEVNFNKSYDAYRGTLAPAAPAPSFPAFLDTAQRQRAAAQWQRLSSYGSAARYLPRVVVEWAKKHPDDGRVPEALHLAVRATRYGCDEGRPNPLSREAFTILHQVYPRSDWARKTPYWF
jgi:hypothetical protein